MKHRKHSKNSLPPPALNRPAGRPKRITDVSAPSDFPAIGSTLSTYRPSIGNGQPLSDGQELPKPKHRHNYKKIAKRIVLTLVILLLIAGGWVGWKFYKNFGGFAAIWGLVHSTKLKGENTGRVNILLAGNSADDPGHNGANLTDSIMIVSIDTRDHTAFLLSIPRDLYVNIPGNGYQRINAAYEDGGMSLLDQVVSQDFGIPIDYHALIDYTAFRDSVNAVGGITVNIQSCSPYGLYDPDRDYVTHGIFVDLSNGEHKLNGEQALDLARARGDAYGSYGFCNSDFTREQDQRLMLVALKNKALSAGVLTNPIKLGNLFDSIGNNVKTDLTLSDIHRLYQLGQKINSNNIKSVGLSTAPPNNLLEGETYYGQDVLVPVAGLDNFTQIQNYMQQITTVSPPHSNN